MSINKIIGELATRAGGGLADELLAEHLPKPKPKHVASSSYTGTVSLDLGHRSNAPSSKQPTPFPAGKGEVVKVGDFELRRKPLWPMEKVSLDDSFKGRPQRGPLNLCQSDWEALAETPVKKGMTFDAWMRECCLPPLVKEYDPDYAAAARLYLALKDKAHRG